jgi:hypothetical protein
MRDPDSFKIGRVWIIQSVKENTWACYTYNARNGFGGMNVGRAIYGPRSKKDMVTGKNILNVDESDNPHPYSLEVCRNGKSPKTLKGEFGELELETPRNRKATGATAGRTLCTRTRTLIQHLLRCSFSDTC